MSDEKPAVAQGFAGGGDRLPLPPDASMTEAQRAAARALREGPRKGVYGPFLPLMQSPELLDRVARVGEQLRFASVLGDAPRELATCAVARHVSNQFEWLMHAPLAAKAGVAPEALEALRAGAPVRGLPADQAAALDFAQELLRTHGVSDITWQAAQEQFGAQGVVELACLVGYFAMVSWLMNAARTPAQGSPAARPLDAFPQ